jgi:hypothetical protein
MGLDGGLLYSQINAKWKSRDGEWVKVTWYSIV